MNTQNMKQYLGHRRAATMIVGLGVALLCGGCPTTVDQPNAFVTLAEDVLGVSAANNGNTGGGSGGGGTIGGGTTGEELFRLPTSVTLTNLDTEADLNVSFAAWIDASRIRTTEQQDLLIDGGYVQLQREANLGVITLPAGTFVFNGPGIAGASPLEIPAGGVEAFNIITPDRVLIFNAPPVGCDSIAYFYTIDGEVLRSPDNPADPAGSLFGAATGGLGIKTLAQIDGTQCLPFAPGFFLKIGGGTKAENEFFEGEPIQISFNRFAQDPNEPTAIVVIGS